MSSERMDGVGGLEHNESTTEDAEFWANPWANPNDQLPGWSTVPLPDPDLIYPPPFWQTVGSHSPREPADDDDRTLSDWSEGYPPFDDEDDVAEPSDRRARPNLTSYGQMPSRNTHHPEMFRIQHNSAEPSVQENADTDSEPPVDPAMVDDYYYHNPNAPNLQYPSRTGSIAWLPLRQSTMASNLASADDPEVTAVATTPSALDPNANDFVEAADPESPESDSYPDLINPFLDPNPQDVVDAADPESSESDSYPDLINPILTPPESRNPSIPVAVDSQSARAARVGSGPVDSDLTHDTVDQPIHLDTDIRGADASSDPDHGLDRLHLLEQDRTQLGQGLTSDLTQDLDQLPLRDQDAHLDETRIVPDIVCSPAHDTVIDPNTQMYVDKRETRTLISDAGLVRSAAPHTVTDALPNDDMEIDVRSVLISAVPEKAVGIVDFILWVANESKSRFLMGFKTRWTSEEIQAVIGKAYQLREARRAADISAPSQEEALAAQAKEFEDAPLEREKNLEKLGKYWDQFHVECVQNLSIMLRIHGATPQDIQTCVNAEGKPDVYQLVAKLWHIQNPTPYVKEFTIHLGRTSPIDYKLQMLELSLDWDMDFQDFWQTLNDFAPHPEYLPEGDPDDGEYHEYDLGDLGILSDDYDKEDNGPIIEPMDGDDEDAEMPDAAVEAPPTGPKLTWTFRVIGDAQIEDLLEKLNGETPAGSHGVKYGRVWEIREEADYEFMRLEMKNPNTPHVILLHQAYIEENRRDCVRKAAFAAKRARESGDVEGEEEWWIQK